MEPTCLTSGPVGTEHADCNPHVPRRGVSPPESARSRSLRAVGERTLEYQPLDELVGADRNPKKHAAGLLEESISEHGFTEPVVVDERTGRLIAGHGRMESLRARQAAGGEAPEGVRTDEQGRWLLPVVRGWASRDDAQASRMLVASNRLVEAGGWDTRDLLSLLDELGAEEPGLLGTGFGSDDLQSLLDQLAASDPQPEPARLSDPDDVPEPPKTPVTKRGDLWLLGGFVECPHCGTHNDL